MREQWIIFKDKETGEELGAYTIRGSFPGEREATIDLLAHERGIPRERIETEIRSRQI